MSSLYSEDALVEQPAIALFAALGWETADCFHETFGPGGSLGRETPAKVVLLPRQRRAQPGLGAGWVTQVFGLARPTRIC